MGGCSGKPVDDSYIDGDPENDVEGKDQRSRSYTKQQQHAMRQSLVHDVINVSDILENLEDEDDPAKSRRSSRGQELGLTLVRTKATLRDTSSMTTQMARDWKSAWEP